MSGSLAQPKPFTLFTIFCGVFAIFLFVGFGLARIEHKPSQTRAVDALKDGRISQAEADLHALLQDDPQDEATWYILLASLATNPHPFPEVFKLDPTGRFLQALNFSLQIMANKPVAVPELYPLQADIGGILMMANQDVKAIEFHQRAERIHPDPETRLRILRTLKDLGWKSDFVRSMDDPLYFNSADDLMRADYYLETNQFLLMARYVLLHQFGSYETILVIASAIVGLCWLVMMLHVGRVRNWPFSVALVIPVVLTLGILSAHATLIAVELESKYFVHGLRHTWIVTLLYAVLGIGLREEFLKLLLIAPVLFAFRKAAPIQILVIATLGGLGFAIEENNQYYVEGGGSVVARFLTANFAHMSWTGLAGYAFVTALNDRRQWGNFLERFAYVILMHGAYDFFLMDKTFGNLGFFSSIVFILSARTHLRLVAEFAGTAKYSIAPITVFVVALAISTGTGYLMFAQEVGPVRGAIEVLLSAAGMVFVGILFFQEFSRDT